MRHREGPLGALSARGAAGASLTCLGFFCRSEASTAITLPDCRHNGVCDSVFRRCGTRLDLVFLHATDLQCETVHGFDRDLVSSEEGPHDAMVLISNPLPDGALILEDGPLLPRAGAGDETGKSGAAREADRSREPLLIIELLRRADLVHVAPHRVDLLLTLFEEAFVFVELREEDEKHGVSEGVQFDLVVHWEKGPIAVVPGETKEVRERTLGVVVGSRAIRVSTTSRSTLSRPSGVLEEARAKVATKIGERISVLTTNAGNLESFLDPIVQMSVLDIAADDHPRVLVGLHRKQGWAVQLDPHEQRETEQPAAAPPRIRMSEKLIEVLLLGLALERGHLETFERNATLRVFNLLMAKGLQVHLLECFHEHR